MDNRPRLRKHVFFSKFFPGLPIIVLLGGFAIESPGAQDVTPSRESHTVRQPSSKDSSMKMPSKLILILRLPVSFPDPTSGPPFLVKHKSPMNVFFPHTVGELMGACLDPIF
jgi:hypothetical protein